MTAVDVVELPATLRLASEDLDQPHADDRFLQERVERGHPGAHGAVRAAHPSSEPRSDHEHHRKHGQRDERQLPVHHQQHDDDPGQLDDVCEDQHEAGRERLVERLDVAGHACHQAADRVAIEERGRQPLEVGEDPRAQIEDHVLSGDLERIELQVAQQELGEQRQQEQSRRQHQGPRVAPGDPLVDRHLEQPWLDDLRGRDTDEQHERGDDEAAVRTDEFPQPKHQATVERPAGGAGFDTRRWSSHESSSRAARACLRNSRA